MFTTLFLLQQLGSSIKASVDGTFKAICPNFAQLFILMVRVCDAWVPVGFGFLPNKHLASYENFLLLLLVACDKFKIRISLQKVYADFEQNIHKSFKRVCYWIKVRGCYFHFTQKIRREVQSKQFITHYSND